MPYSRGLFADPRVDGRVAREVDGCEAGRLAGDEGRPRRAREEARGSAYGVARGKDVEWRAEEGGVDGRRIEGAGGGERDGAT